MIGRAVHQSVAPDAACRRFAPSAGLVSSVVGPHERERCRVFAYAVGFVTSTFSCIRMSSAAVAGQSTTSTICPESVVLAAGRTRLAAVCSTRSMNVGRNASVLVGSSRLARSGGIMLANSAFERARISVVGMRVTALVCDRLRARRSTPRWASH